MSFSFRYFCSDASSSIMGLPYNISDLANLTLMVFSFIFPGPPEGLHVPFPPRDSRLLAGLQEVAHDSAGSPFCFNVPALLSIVLRVLSHLYTQCMFKFAEFKG